MAPEAHRSLAETPPPPEDPTTPPPVVADRPIVVVPEAEPTVASLGVVTTKPPETLGRALLSISTDPPGASVWIDDNPAGQAPVAREVPLGSYNVKAAMDGYVTQTVRISVSEESGNDARIPLKRKPTAQINVTLYGQPNSQIFVNGVLVGSLPVSTALKAGTHRFKVVTPNGVSYEVTREILPGTQSISLLPD